MSAIPSRFDPRSPADTARLLRGHPFAWLVSADDAEHGGELHATTLPLLTDADAEGRILRISGHFPRHSPHVAALRRQPQALLLFLGPHGYISPWWFADRTQTPTWNYARAQVRATLRFHDDEQRLRDDIRELVDAHEAGREGPWNVDEMGERYGRLARGIVGFDAEVVEVQGRFKPGQDERDDVFADIVRRLAAQPAGGAGQELLPWMLAFNPARRP